MIDIGTLGGSWSAGYSINNAGEIAGSAQTRSGYTRAFVWDRAGGMRELGGIGGRESRGMAINSQGTVAGAATTRSRYFHATLWNSAGGAQDLGTLGGTSSYAYALNDSGYAVGFSYDSQGRSRAFVWNGNMLFDLNELISNTPGWSLTAAYGINARGQIVGTGTYMGQSAAFRLDPVFLTSGALLPARSVAGVNASSDLSVSSVPEPGSLALIGSGVLLFSLRRNLRLTKRY
jgi:probable HAF family extracellular repeat protein